LTTALAALTGAEAPGGYALPMDDSMRRIIEVLRQGREVEYGFLGVTLVEDTFKGQGAFIREVSRGSPADRAGLMDGDCIKSINGMPVRENDDLLLLVGTQLAGGVAKVQVSRGPNGVRTTRDVKLAKFYVPNPPLASQRPPARRGLRVDYTSVVSQRAAVRQTIPDGVLIREVKPGSPAESARLQTDKVILQVNDQPVTTPTEFYAAMEKADKAPASPVVLTVLQSDGSLERVVLEPDAR
jgi:S1-C subfamily serine protease